MAENSAWLEVSLIVDGEMAEAVAEVLGRFAGGGAAIESTRVVADAEDEGHAEGPLRVCGYLPVDAELEASRRKLEEALWHLGQIRPLPEAQFRTIQEQDWAEAWKEHYRPLRVGRRVLIVPAWMEAGEAGRVAVKIDPGMAFGTGTHPTTQLCLELIDEILSDPDIVGAAMNLGQRDSSVAPLPQNDTPESVIPSAARNPPEDERPDHVIPGAAKNLPQNDRPQDVIASRPDLPGPAKQSRAEPGGLHRRFTPRNDNIQVIDVGCGSGILSIAALLLGAGRALAVDTDAEAVQATRENAGLNGILDRLETGQGSVAEILAGRFSFRQAPLVVANILAPVLIRLFGQGLAELVAPGGWLILSGILAEQSEGVEAAARGHGFAVEAKRQSGDWLALLVHQ